MTTIDAVCKRYFELFKSQRALVWWLIVAALCVLPNFAFAQETSAPASPSHVDGDAQDIFRLRPEAKEFKFAHSDQDLYRQVEAFDKYIADKGWLYSDAVTDEYINRVGRALIPSQTPEKVTWRFRVIRDPVPNAFALPNGSIYIHSGLLSRLENEAQLAGVLAHEVTHVYNRHTYLAFHDMRRKSVAAHVIAIGASAAGFAGIDVRVVTLVGNLLPMIAVEMMFGYRRELEHEADVYAVRMLQHAGYDAREMAHALELLKKGPEVDLSEHSVFWADHPKLESRVKYTADLAQRLSGGTSGKVERQPYEVATQKAIAHDARLAMILGRPRTAVAVGRRLLQVQPKSAEYHALLGDAYRSLGGRTAQPEPQELTDEGKSAARTLMRKTTLPEYDKALMENPAGRDHWKSNCAEAEHSYRHALEIDSTNPEAHRGLGYVYETSDRSSAAIAEFRKYMELEPKARDARLIGMRLEALEKRLATEQNRQGSSQ